MEEKEKISSSVKKCISDERRSKLNSLSGIKKYSKWIEVSKKKFNKFAEKALKNKIVAGIWCQRDLNNIDLSL